MTFLYRIKEKMRDKLIIMKVIISKRAKFFNENSLFCLNKKETEKTLHWK